LAQYLPVSGEPPRYGLASLGYGTEMFWRFREAWYRFHCRAWTPPVNVQSDCNPRYLDRCSPCLPNLLALDRARPEGSRHPPSAAPALRWVDKTLSHRPVVTVCGHQGEPNPRKGSAPIRLSISD